MKNINVIDIHAFKLKKLLHDEEYQQKEIMRRKQLLYDYDYKIFLKGVNKD